MPLDFFPVILALTLVGWRLIGVLMFWTWSLLHCCSTADRIINNSCLFVLSFGSTLLTFV